MTADVAGRELDVPLPGATMNTWRYAPSGPGRLPAVLLLMDAPGLRPALHGMARRLAGAGYLVLMPNLYHRIGREVSVGPTRQHPDEAANRERMFGLIATLSNAGVVADVQGLVGHLAHDPQWDGGPVGLTGYCMSGRFAVLAAQELGPRAACAASYFGTRLVTQDPSSPHRTLAGTTAELYFAFAEHDPYVPPEAIQALQEGLAAAGVRHRVETYPGTEHGFTFTDRGSYHQAADGRHWGPLLELLARNLSRG